MPILDWNEKKAIVNHDKKLPFRLFEKDKSKSVGNSDNIIIEGDNLEALKALLPHYQNKIKCIYIDPPYNTGNTTWEYNDNVDSPTIRQWLKENIVDVEDLNRHDKWLCMMYPRLKLLRELLSEDGAIFISIDDAEQSRLKQILDEIFHKENFVANIIWQKKRTSANDARFISDNHDFILLYGKNIDKLKINFSQRTKEQEELYENPDNDPRGVWASGPIQVKTPNVKDIYEITTPSGRKVLPPKGTSWRFSRKKLDELIKDNRIYFGKSGNNVPRFKRFLTEVKEGVIDKTIWFAEDVGDNQEGKTEFKKIMPNQTFATPKPTRLIKKIIKMVCDNNDIILDSFAGSGTTGESVLQLNKEDGGNRKFILIELDPKICKNITSQRVKNIIKKSYKDEKSTELYKKELNTTNLKNMDAIFDEIEEIKIENKNFKKFSLKFKNKTLSLFGEIQQDLKSGTGGGFQYAVLDKKLFNSDGSINDECTFEELASYLYFSETKTILDTKNINKTLLNTRHDTQIHLMFDGVGKNNLDRKFLSTLDKNKDKIIYADKCTLDDSTLEKHKTVFKQIPYDLKEF
jgi:adenine-specific DNA-methyltransferase